MSEKKSTCTYEEAFGDSYLGKNTGEVIFPPPVKKAGPGLTDFMEYDGMPKMDTKTFEAISRGALNTDKGTLFHNFIDLGSDKTRILSNVAYDLLRATNGNSTSIGKSLASTKFTTTGIEYVFDKPMWSEASVGVLGTKTKLTENTLFLGEDLFGTPHYILNVSDGIKIFGHTYFEGNSGTAQYASGFSNLDHGRGNGLAKLNCIWESAIRRLGRER